MGAKQRDCAVVIIGAGPCGLTLAIELGRRRIPVIVLEERTSRARFPAANATQARTMEHYRRLGFADEIRAQGLPPDYPTDIAYFDRYTKHELARFRLPSSRTARDIVKTLSGSWSAAELPHRCSQMYVERVLRAHAEAMETVSIRTGWRAIAVRQTADAVAVEAEQIDPVGRDIKPASDAANPGSGQHQILRASYAIGADGGGSPTRKALGYELVGESGIVRDFMGGRMFAMHLRSPDLYRVIPHAPAWQYWAVNRERRAVLISLNGRDEFVVHTQLTPGQQAGQISNAAAKAMFHVVLGAELDVELIARSTWNAGYTLVAEKFQHGRILLAGDAVHLFTPTGGLGYNTAVEDAVNLGWKLAAALKGWAGAGLIDSYEGERQAIARRNTGYARKFADSVGLFIPLPELEDDSEAGETARKRAGEHLDAHARFEFNIPGITFGGRYDGSPIIVSDGTLPPPDTVNDYVPTACPGGRAPHLWLEDGRSLYDALGLEFTVLRLGPCPRDATQFAAAAATLGIPLATVSLATEEARDLYEADLALIRPDQIVAWRGDASADAMDVLRRASGHLRCR
jgi:2-polyprenyl-6-methoxyphenol hydroxylase-like FAD-dependent oxidoreductase